MRPPSYYYGKSWETWCQKKIPTYQKQWSEQWPEQQQPEQWFQEEASFQSSAAYRSPFHSKYGKQNRRDRYKYRQNPPPQ